MTNLEVVAELDDLMVSFTAQDGSDVTVVRGVSLQVQRGKTLGVVGESGAGKSMLSLCLMGLIPSPGRVSNGSIKLLGRDVHNLSEKEWQKLRGAEVAMVFQDPMTALNPVRTIGATLISAIRNHQDVSKADARERAIEVLRSVGMPAPEERVLAYPHELSGGLRQRAVIALALVNSPSVIIADEPTTALDTTIQTQILELLRTRVQDSGMVFISHDLGLASEISDHIAVLYGGRVMEYGTTREVMRDPRHHYTNGLLKAVPQFTSSTQELVPIEGTPPSPRNMPPGCPFAPRCAAATEQCNEIPPLVGTDDHKVACWHPVSREESAS
jgi:oligopeptide/dipeptide ABC transporter ATP-binding protein